MKILRAPYWSGEESQSSFGVIDIAGISECACVLVEDWFHRCGSLLGIGIFWSPDSLAWDTYCLYCILVNEE